VAFSLMNLSAYAALGFGFFNFVNLNIASLRIRMLQEMAQSPRGMSRCELLACYNIDEVIALRIDRLVRGGHLVERDGRFYSGKLHFLVLARIFDFLRFLIMNRRRKTWNEADAALPSNCVSDNP